MDIENVVVIGSGAMGSGIAYLAAVAGSNVTIVDREEEYIKNGMKKIRHKLKEGIDRGKMSPADAEKLSKRFSTSTNTSEAVQNADLVIEAAFENMNVKKEIFALLSSNTKPEAILATNTSTLSVTEIATVVDTPERVVGMHFFNPPEAMKLVEIVVGEKTSQDTIRLASEYATKIGKTPIECKDSPGFIVNRLLVPMLNEAIKIYDEGIATIEDIDKASVLGANFPAGPFTLADMVGLDVALASMRTLEKELGESYAPSKSLVENVEAGKLGMKSGEGFYKY